ncbi:imidazole glycerol phosphate synthase subunit HisF [Mangrovivirga sp. M17]|uniref:Imidazole glycerol phosphate synthase subunit HisF n=1 Tax=Mangrovivirga halotolerans TaxID=2993936 RepID=A0ABT3RX62_9BACT|nr:imidazole glycerol phosphate synthase subunit HisF [Mangrovivirga halotolerans]MCX2745720.1 imidazole glycerol phosphate synthase subunit HisF [Mangrovivirga halotolerans]
MLSKRIIPCLDIKDGRTVKGINFVDLVDAGDPVEQAAVYASQGADELVFLDITATVEKRKTLVDLVRKVGSQVDIPFTVGGGISSIEDVSALLDAGADKISVNSSVVKDPSLVDKLALEFGSQCVVVAVDTRFVDGEHIVHVRGGRTPTDKRTFEWIKEVYDRGAGEILLTSMDHDGTKQGFACELMRELNEQVDIPVIASGGAGSMEHFYDVFTHGNADAGLAASIFHFHEIGIPELKRYLLEKGLTIRL